MGKIKTASQDEKACTRKNTQSVTKKRKRKGNKGLLNSIHKNNFKERKVSNEIVKNIFTNTQNSKKRKNRNSTNKHDAEDKGKSKNPTKYSKYDSKTTETFIKVQSNFESKTKCQKRNKKRKQNTNSNQTNNNTAEANISAVKINKKLQIPAKKPIGLEHNDINRMKIQNAKKINQKKTKQISTKTETQQIEYEKILTQNKNKINFKQFGETFIKSQVNEYKLNKSQRKLAAQSLTLRDRMMLQLKGSRFRFINDTLYNNESSQSQRYFKEDPCAFEAYHDGYKQQLAQWPLNPLNVIISSIKKMPAENVIADFGCGDAQLAASVPHTVHSFDFIALNDRVKACDITHTPLLMNSVHVVVFCLSLMGINLSDYIKEANRVLKINGILKIAEVESRFEDVRGFIRVLGNYGFKNTWQDLSHNMFYFMDFKKEEDISMKRKNLPPITLKPCLYKKR